MPLPYTNPNFPGMRSSNPDPNYFARMHEINQGQLRSNPMMRNATRTPYVNPDPNRFMTRFQQEMRNNPPQRRQFERPQSPGPQPNRAIPAHEGMTNLGGGRWAYNQQPVSAYGSLEDAINSMRWQDSETTTNQWNEYQANTPGTDQWWQGDFGIDNAMQYYDYPNRPSYIGIPNSVTRQEALKNAQQVLEQSQGGPGFTAWTPQQVDWARNVWGQYGDQYSQYRGQSPQQYNVPSNYAELYNPAGRQARAQWMAEYGVGKPKRNDPNRPPMPYWGPMTPTPHTSPAPQNMLNVGLPQLLGGG